MLKLQDIKEMDLSGFISWEAHPIKENIRRISSVSIEPMDYDTDLVPLEYDITDSELNNLRSLWIDEKHFIVARTMPFLHEYASLSEADRADFLSDKVTMIEYIHGDSLVLSLNQGELFYHDEKDGEVFHRVKEIFNLDDFEGRVMTTLALINTVMKGNCSIVLTLSHKGKVYITSVLRNTIDILRMKERQVNFLLNNINQDFSSKLERVVYFTTSLNESNHKPNIEWMMQSNGNYCLLLNHIKKV